MVVVTGAPYRTTAARRGKGQHEWQRDRGIPVPTDPRHSSLMPDPVDPNNGDFFDGSSAHAAQPIALR